MLISACSDYSFIIITVEEFEAYEATLQLDIDNESVMGFSVLTGETTTTLSEVRKLTYIATYTLY